MELARHGGGVALVSRFLATPSVSRGELCVPLARSAPAKDDFYIAVRDDREESPARRFERWLRGELEKVERLLPA